MDREVVDLYLDDIIPNRFQPREVFNEQALRELSDSIKAHGVIQPIIVRKIGDKYEIIAGERRYKASAMAGLTKIPAIIRNLDDKETSKVALLENLQRKDLTPIEEARTYEKIIELDNMTQEELGRTMGKSQASIANKMRLLSLPDEVQEALLENRISERHARSLLNLNTAEEQISMLHNIIENRMTVRELDAKIKGISKEKTEEQPRQEQTTIFSQVQGNENSALIESEPADIKVNNPIHSIFTPRDEVKIESPLPNRSFEVNESMAERKPVEPSFTETSNSIREESIFTPRVEETMVKKQPDLLAPTQYKESRPEIEELLDDEELYSLRDAVSEIRRGAEIVRSRGFVVKVEEMDFEKSYQIVIKIDKDI